MDFSLRSMPPTQFGSQIEDEKEKDLFGQRRSFEHNSFPSYILTFLNTFLHERVQRSC